MATAIIGALTALLTLLGAYLAYKKTTSPADRYEASLKKIAALAAELETCRAVGGNAAAYRADRLRAQIATERRNAEYLAALRADD